MSNIFVTFRKFNDEESVAELVEQLKSHNIEYVVEDYSSQIDNAFGNSNIGQEFRVKLQKEDFTKAYELLQEIYTPIVNNVAPDYYLFGFTNEELIDLIRKRDEWGIFDFVLAQKILADRGQSVTTEHINNLQEERITELNQPASNQEWHLTIAYALIPIGLLIYLHFLLASCLMGLFMWSNKKALPNGDLVYIYSPSVRRQGLILFIVVLLIYIFLMLILLGYVEIEMGYLSPNRPWSWG